MEFKFSSESRTYIIDALPKHIQKDQADACTAYVDDNESAINFWLQWRRQREVSAACNDVRQKVINDLRRAYQKAIEDLTPLGSLNSKGYGMDQLHLLICISQEDLERELRRYEANMAGTLPTMPAWKSSVGHPVAMSDRMLAIKTVNSYRRRFGHARGLAPAIKAVWQRYCNDKSSEMPPLARISKTMLDGAVRWVDNRDNESPKPWGPMLNQA